MTHAKQLTFYLEACLGAAACMALLAGCPPSKQEFQQKGVFKADTNRIYDRGDGFDLKDRIVRPTPKIEGLVNADINVTDRQLTFYRCGWCHGCTFDEVFDKANYGKPEWSPKIKGEDWQAIVVRMGSYENSMLNEVIAERIYNFLRDSTTGKYDESKDTKGALIRPAPGGDKAPPAKPPLGKE